MKLDIYKSFYVLLFKSDLEIKKAPVPGIEPGCPKDAVFETAALPLCDTGKNKNSSNF